MNGDPANGSKNPSAIAELFALALDYQEKIEKYAMAVTKAVGEIDKIRSLLEAERAAIKISWIHKLCLFLKAFIPYIPVVFLLTLFFLPCGINWDGFGVKFSNAICHK